MANGKSVTCGVVIYVLDKPRDHETLLCVEQLRYKMASIFLSTLAIGPIINGRFTMKILTIFIVFTTL